MLRLGLERILLIGDTQREIETALTQAMPTAQIKKVGNVFEGLAKLSAAQFSTVLAAAEPIERRPEAAVQQLRELAGSSRLILFGKPDMEPLSRKMLEFGCDDYLVTPANPHEIHQMFGAPLLRIAPSTLPDPTNANGVAAGAAEAKDTADTPPAEALSESVLNDLPLAELLLDMLVRRPGDAPAACVTEVNTLIAPGMQLHYAPCGKDAPQVPAGMTSMAHGVRTDNKDVGQLHLHLSSEQDNATARHFLAQFAHLLGKVVDLRDRHHALQTLAITDPLTGAYNRRWFEHFLKGILKHAQVKRFWVTLLVFDIDNFKKYNDEFGHGLGDEILRETARLMRRCSREHDLVARIGGDEFAVVFWDKEPRRRPKDPAKPLLTRPPQEPTQIFERFRRLMATREFPGLGKTGQGKLTISGGLASYPWDGRDVKELLAAADQKLMFVAKRAGKNTLFLVGDDERPAGEAELESETPGPD